MTEFPHRYDERREQMAPRDLARDDARLYGYGFTLKRADGTEEYLPLQNVIVHGNITAPTHIGDKAEVVEGCECAICKMHRK